ncbi:MAG TPA: hypothetical protein ENL37_10190 [Desulfobacteraceae bacterium]|nr:hypothetical protein [Desulfobacteraceae bacterium]
MIPVMLGAPPVRISDTIQYDHLISAGALAMSVFPSFKSGNYKSFVFVFVFQNIDPQSQYMESSS